ncbi:glucan 1,3-beta-glucosidase GLUC78 precursor, partial [Podospora aff. communis PSN243]
MYRNQYILRPGTEPGARLSRREEAEIYIRAKADSLAAGADQITDEEREAARRLTEYEARQKAKSGTLFADYEELGVAPPEPTAATEKRQAGGSWWAERLDHVVGGPFGLNPQYRVWRNVKDYGAKGNGVDDDTAAIKRAVQEGNRCGDKCNGTTTTPATIYFPQGTYLLSEEILGLFHTQFVGDPTPGRTPVLKASKFFQGESVISTDYCESSLPYIPGGSGAQWWINTANFYRQLRNFIIDIRDVDFQDAIYGIHYQAAQACSIENVQIHARRKDYITAHGIHAENGSGGTMHGVVVLGADVGIWGGNQQYTAIGVQIRDCTVGIHMIWDWGWTWQNILMENVEIGFQLVGEDEKYRGVGSIYLLDSTISASKVQIQIMPYNKGPANGNTQITIDNCAFSGTSTVIADINGKPYFSMTGNIDAYIWGNVANPENPAGTWREGLRMDDMKRDEGLTFPGNNGLKHKPYFVKMKPSYTNLSPSDIVQVGKSCPRNGRDDATQCIQRILDANSGLSGPTKIIFFDYGTYKVTDTLNIHPGTYIVGESWSQLVASGEKFGDMKKPRPLVRVGKKDEVGTVEIQDIMFTTMGATAGLVAVEWNLKGKSPHDAAMWDSHVRIGGAAETGLAMKDCPLGSTVDNKCIAGSMLMHITSSASGYFENVWLWVADHDIEDIAMTQVNVYVGRGLLVESQNPVWLYGTSSEHCVLYQYQFHKAKRIYAGMIQTESPYYQPSPAAPAPFESALGIFPADPTFKEKGVDLKSSWGVRIIRSSDIVIAGAGLYSWFSSYAQQPCISELACQNSMVEINNVGQGVYIWNLVTIGTTQMITDTTISPPRVVLAKPNINADDDNAGQGHPKWALLNIYQPNPGAGVDSCVTVYDDMIWEWDRP